MIYIETEHLILRNYKPTDFNDVFAYFSNEEVSRYEDFYPMSAEQVWSLIDEWKTMDNRLVAELRSNGTVIGSIGYWTDEERHHCIDYDFNPAFGKNGYATEAGKALVSHLFDTLDVTAVYGDCDVENTASWKLLERLGFERIQRLDQQSYKNDLDGNPIMISTYLYEQKRPDTNRKSVWKDRFHTIDCMCVGARRI